LEWFSLQFPYYYDKCVACGASAKDDVDIECIQGDGNNDAKKNMMRNKMGHF
jgi:translation initiation factor 1 (eIF-1/SUI1)